MFSPPMISVKKCVPKFVDNTSSALHMAEDIDIERGYFIHTKTLGEGGFGTVRLATHKTTGQKVAIKSMNKIKLKGDLFRVKIEINALKHLSHENIAKLLQVIETNEDIHLVLEYCSGGELFDYLLAKKRLSEEETKEIIRDLVKALDYIHSVGFAHRDIKPENILFDKKHKIKLIDFGLSAHCRDLSQTLVHLKTCCGSPAYAAPELLKGVSYSGPAVDIWSTGIMVYVLLVGKFPFDDQNLTNLYRKIQSGNYYLPKFLSQEARDLISSMLQTDPILRTNTKRLLEHPWLATEDSLEEITDENMLKTSDVFLLCRQKFPNYTIPELRERILKGFGYQTATYWLIRDNPQLFHTMKAQIKEVIPRAVERRRSRSASAIPYIIDKRNTPKAVPIVNSAVNPNHTTRKISLKTLKVFQLKPTEKSSAKKCPKVLFGQMFANSPSKTGEMSPKTPIKKIREFFGKSPVKKFR